jgi:hypothetical protein
VVSDAKLSIVAATVLMHLVLVPSPGMLSLEISDALASATATVEKLATDGVYSLPHLQESGLLVSQWKPACVFRKGRVKGIDNCCKNS